jgi:glycosyltransferase involved in cell wall biosynthesis
VSTVMPAVSFIMPVHNNKAFIARALSSALGQSESDIEVIIIDDASTDATLSEVERFETDRRIIVIEKKTRVGVATARNVGLATATAEFIAFLDADDVAAPERVAKQLDIFRRYPTVGIVGSTAVIVNEREQRLRTWHRPIGSSEIAWEALFTSPFVLSSVTVRRDAVGDALRFDDAYPVAEDYELVSRLLKRTNGLNVNRPLCLYRTHQTQTTRARRDQQLAEHLEIAIRSLEEIGEGIEYMRSRLYCRLVKFVGLHRADEEEDVAELAWCYSRLLQQFASSRGWSDRRLLRARAMELFVGALLRTGRTREILPILGSAGHRPSLAPAVLARNVVMRAFAATQGRRLVHIAPVRR